MPEFRAGVSGARKRRLEEFVRALRTPCVVSMDQRSPDFTLKLDRSDAKITLANINKNLCLVHGTWRL